MTWPLWIGVSVVVVLWTAIVMQDAYHRGWTKGFNEAKAICLGSDFFRNTR